MNARHHTPAGGQGAPSADPFVRTVVRHAVEARRAARAGDVRLLTKLLAAIAAAIVGAGGDDSQAPRDVVDRRQ